MTGRFVFPTRPSVPRILAILSILTLPLMQAPATSLAAPGKQTLVIAYHAAPSDLDPASNYDSPGAAILRGAYEGLVRLKGRSTMALEGALATSWKSSKHGAVWTFFLRHNVRFHDGTLLTASAVKTSLSRELTLNQGPAFIVGQFVTPKNIQVVNRYTVRFKLNAASDVFPRALAAEWGNWILSPKAIAQHTHNLHTWLQSHEDGTGPYVLSHIVHGQTITLTRFSKYWGGWSGHHVQRIIFNIVTTDATRRELVEKGDADLTETLTPGDLVALEKNHSVVVDKSYGMTNLAMVMTDGGKLKSPLARRAMGYAFNYTAFIKDLLKGFARQAQGPLPRNFLGHDSKLPLYSTNLSKARQLLHQAGVKSGTTLTLWYQSGDEATRNAAVIMQAQLSQIGITLKIQEHDIGTFQSAYYGNAPAAQRPNFWIWYWFPDYNDPGDWLFPQYSSKEWGSKGANGGFYKNKTVDRLLNRATLMSNTAQRLKLYNTVQRIVTWDDPAAVFLTEMPESTVYRKTLHGYYLNPVYTATYNYYKLWKS